MSDKSPETPDPIAAAREERYLTARLMRAAKQNEDVLALLTVRGDLAHANLALNQDNERLRTENGTLEQQREAQRAELVAWTKDQKEKVLATLARQQKEIERLDAVIIQKTAQETEIDQRLDGKVKELRRVTAIVDAAVAAGAER